MDTSCPGCGKRLKDIKAWENHAKWCKKLEKVLQLSYNIPTVSMEDLPYLEVKILLPKGKDWGIWNIKRDDWIRDKNGQIDSRLFRRNIKALLNSLTAKSIIAPNSPPSTPSNDLVGEPEGSPRDVLLLLLLLLIFGAVVIAPIVIFGIMHGHR